MSDATPTTDDGVTATAAKAANPDRYKWIALTNTTIGVLLITISGSITLISLPNIFDGIKLDPLAPGNTSYFLWMLMGFLLVTAVLVVSFGRVGDMYGRVKMYNLGFAIFTFFSILLSVTWMHGRAGALWLIIMRIFQGIGGAFLFANSSAILTDAFPQEERGLALGINSVAAISGSFLGLLIGGVLAPVDWRLVFLVGVPFGLFGTVWAYVKLVDNGVRVPAKIDWAGNITFAIGLISILTGIVYSIQPYGGHTMGWTNPGVIAALAGGVLTLITFGFIETRSPDPMFRLHLFGIRAFSAGNLANLLGALGRGGIQFILILWLQGIWLPQHGYSFSRTPLWAGIYMVPLTIGFLIAGPISGVLSDRYGARPFATGGMIAAAASFFLLTFLPINFGYGGFAAILLLLGLGMGVFASPNRAGVMNALPPDQRGAGAGMMNTFQNASTVLSIGIFFALITVGMASTLPSRLTQALQSQGVSPQLSHTVGATPPLDSLFSAFLGENPITTLNKQFHGALLQGRTPAQTANLTGRGFFSHVLSSPFGTGLHYALYFAVACSIIAAVASLLRGKKYYHGMNDEPALATAGDTGVEPSATAPIEAEAALASVGGGTGTITGSWTGGRGSGADDTEPAATGRGQEEPVLGTSATTNGHGTNGHTTNGHSTNGHSTNGHSTNGHSTNGQTTSGRVGATVRRDDLPMAQLAGANGDGQRLGGADDGRGTTNQSSWSFGAPDGSGRGVADGSGNGTTADQHRSGDAQGAPVERAVPEVVDPGQDRADADTSELSVTVTFRLTNRPPRRR